MSQVVAYADFRALATSKSMMEVKAAGACVCVYVCAMRARRGQSTREELQQGRRLGEDDGDVFYQPG